MMKNGGKWALGALLVASSPTQAEINMTEGFWETVVTISIGRGFFPVPAIKSSKCLTRADPIPNSETNMRCQKLEQNVQGNDVTWRMQCSDERATMEGIGKITYAGTRFNGEMKMLVSERGTDRRMDMKYILRGERLRACDVPAQ